MSLESDFESIPIGFDLGEWEMILDEKTINTHADLKSLILDTKSSFYYDCIINYETFPKIIHAGVTNQKRNTDPNRSDEKLGTNLSLISSSSSYGKG